MSNPFANQSHNYAGYRPVYPDELVEFLATLTKKKQKVWDCGTGNGQLALKLTKHFKEIFATDISAEQIANATAHPQVFYSSRPAEASGFPDNYFDLITVAQAVHWFNFEKFYDEVVRTLKPNGVLALIGYGLFRITPEVNRDIDDFYAFTGPYWDPERKYLDDRYQTIPFPFNEIKVGEFKFVVN
jgi:ubiquinone/menaquinone biosynthesis C-methylase UbiE